MREASRDPLPRWWRVAAVGAIVGFGAWTRLAGFSRGSLWFDDAWSAMPARVGLSTALRMVTTAPLYTVGLRSWIRLQPNATWWAQLPAFVVGLAGIVAVFALLVAFRVWWPLPYVGALTIAVSPVVVDYSTRVKQFGVDLLVACALLWLFERWRREPARSSAVALGVACGVALLVSATTLVVVVAVVGLVALAGIADRPRRRQAAMIVGTAAAAALAVYLVWLRHLSPRLYTGWSRRGYLLSTSSTHRIIFSFEAMSTGVLHWFVGMPTGRGPGESVTTLGVTLALLSTALLAAICVPPLIALVRSRGRGIPALAPAACSIALAVALALLAKSPFGGGRTDEVLYPSLLLLLAGAVSWLVARRAEPSVRLARVVLVVAACVLAVVGVTHRAAYPTTDLRALDAKLVHAVTPGEVVVVDPWLTFTWGYDQLSPTRVSFAPTALPWSQGFHVVSRRRPVVISVNYFFADRSYSRLSSRTHRIWYVAATIGRQSSIPNHKNHLAVTANYVYLRQLGWTPTGRYLTAAHTEAIELVYVTPPA